MSWFFSKSGGLEPETIIWRDGIISAGGAFEADSIAIADALVKQMKTRSYFSKIKYLNPFLGSGIIAPMMPLIDVPGVGIGTNVGGNFVGADFSQATGLTSDGSTKILDTKILLSSLGGTDSGGFGWIEDAYTSAGNSGMMGCTQSTGDYRFILGAVAAGAFLLWGFPVIGNAYVQEPATTHVSSRLYGQRLSSTDRGIFVNGTRTGTDNTATGALSLPALSVHLFGQVGAGPTYEYYDDRCHGAYITDGQFTDGEVTDCDDDLVDFLLTPTGR